VISEPAWMSIVGTLIFQTILTLQGQGSPSRNLAHKQSLEIVDFDPLKML
jgi:hypothetical protein